MELLEGHIGPGDTVHLTVREGETVLEAVPSARPDPAAVPVP